MRCGERETLNLKREMSLQEGKGMALRKPTSDDLHRLAMLHNFTVGNEEIDAYQSLIPDMFAVLDALDLAPSHLPPVMYHERDQGSVRVARMTR